MNSESASFLRILKHPVKFRMFLLLKLPSAFFSGLKIESADERACLVRVPYNWFTQNPFRSTYFACLSMAAEMSTGALAMAHIYKRNPAISMLVIKTEANYFKKATGITRFYCDEGIALSECIERAASNGEGQVLRVKSIGTNSVGELVAEFFITWSFRRKNSL